MGQQVIAKCECGYEEGFMIGCGMSNCGTMFSFPCLCRDCKRIVEGNLEEQPLTCPECDGRNLVPYDKAELSKSRDGEAVTEWSGRKLTDDPHYCPQCDTFRLRFENTFLMWD